MGGVLSSLQGGSFGSGFVSAGLVALAMPAIKINISGQVRQALVGALAGGTISQLTGGKFASGAVSGALQVAMMGGSPPSELATGSGDGEIQPVSVPDSIKVEKSGFKTPSEAALAAGGIYGPEGVTRQQEAQLAITQIDKNNWGYLTPSWGPKDATRVDPTNLFNAYRAAGYKIKYWMQGHFDGNLNFSAIDFSLVWRSGKSAPSRKTFMVNRMGEVRFLTSEHLESAFRGIPLRLK